jgi:hypothetical protein
VLHYRCDPYLFFFLGCRSDQNRVHPSVRHLNWKTVPFRLNTTCVRNSITGSVCGFLPLSLSSLSVGKEREREKEGPPFFLFCCVPAHCWIVSCKGERENSLSLCVMAYTRRKGNAFVIWKRADFYSLFFVCVCCPRCCCFRSNFKVKEIPVFECQPLTPTDKQQLVVVVVFLFLASEWDQTT